MNGLLRADVTQLENGLATQVTNGFGYIGTGWIDISQYHSGTFMGEGFSGGFTNASGGTGNQNYFL